MVLRARWPSARRTDSREADPARLQTIVVPTRCTLYMLIWRPSSTLLHMLQARSELSTCLCEAAALAGVAAGAGGCGLRWAAVVRHTTLGGRTLCHRAVKHVPSMASANCYTVACATQHRPAAAALYDVAAARGGRRRL